MEAEARYTWVGAAVIALLAALVGGLLWLKGSGNEAGFQRYAIHFERQALDGLEVGAEVTLRGIRIGRVVDYALADDKLNRVRVEVRLDLRAPVRTNTVAVISRNYVTGIAGIALVTREPPGPPLTQVPEGETYPLIAEGRSEIDDVASRVGQVGDKISFALSAVNQLLSADNRETAMACATSPWACRNACRRWTAHWAGWTPRPAARAARPAAWVRPANAPRSWPSVPASRWA